MPVHVRLIFAVVLVAAASCWTVAVLAHDVHVDGSDCGSTLFTARGMHGADVGGDGGMTTQFADTCVSHGRAAARWVAAPAALGLLATGYAALQLRGAVRESRRRWDDRYRPVGEHQLH